MSSIIKIVFALAPFHLLSYGTLLGTQLYQSFVMTKLSFRALPSAQFRTLQKWVFPAYFRLQVGLVALTAVTHPPGSVLSLARCWADCVPLALALGVSVTNMLVYGPRTREVMVERAHQQMRDRGRRDETGVMSADMERINREFARTHAMAIHLNAIAMIATVWYGFSLAARIEVA